MLNKFLLNLKNVDRLVLINLLVVYFIFSSSIALANNFYNIQNSTSTTICETYKHIIEPISQNVLKNYTIEELKKSDAKLFEASLIESYKFLKLNYSKLKNEILPSLLEELGIEKLIKPTEDVVILQISIPVATLVFANIKAKMLLLDAS